MSMKFFSGLQDLLGLYEPGSTTSPASAIPPTTSVFPPPPAHSSANAVRKKTTDANQTSQDGMERIRQCSHDRSVSFPDGESLVTGYSEAPRSSFHSGANYSPVDLNEIVIAYRTACQRLHCPPSASIERQVLALNRENDRRHEALSLKGERISHAQMEALEEIFKCFQFKLIDFEYTFLDDECAISLGEMLEFYDSCTRLNLSFNKQIDLRGWTAIFRAIRNCNSLEVLNLRYTALNEKAMPPLCRMLRASPCPVLTALHLENTNIAGKNLLILICALKSNTNLKELYLGDNGLQPTDGAHLYQLIVSNYSIQLLDLRNNNLGDNGVRHIADAMRHVDAVQNTSLSAIVLWSNQITGASMNALAEALKVNHRIDTLNIGSNNIGVVGVSHLKSALVSGACVRRLGLQNTHLDGQGAIILAECLADNRAMVRVDIRDNPIGLAGLFAIHSAMKMNRSILMMNIDADCVKSSSEKDEFRKYYDEIQLYCERNKCEDEAHIHETPKAGDDDDVLTPCDSSPRTCDEHHDHCRQLGGDVTSAMPTIVEGTSSEVKSVASDCEKGVEPKPTKDVKKAPHVRFARSSSLTCTETVHDLHDRLREMSGSTHSLDNAVPLDAASNAESLKTIKKPSPSQIHPTLAEWGSLPALPQASPTAQPVVRKARRFSVSPSSSVFDVSTAGNAVPARASVSLTTTVEASLPSCDLPTTPAPRPHSLAIGIPMAGNVDSGPSSAPHCSSLPISMELWSPTEPPKDEPPKSPVRLFDSPPVLRKISEETTVQPETHQQIDNVVRSVVADLVNYVVYEETSVVERKVSMLLQSTVATKTTDTLLNIEVKKPDEPIKTPSTPSRVLFIAEELSEESDELVVSSVVRGLVRDVLQTEKDHLRSTLDRKRRSRPNSTVL